MILILGAFLGLISVAFGAYAEHGLRGVVTEENFRFLMTAVRYNQVHSVVITVIGLTLVWERTPIDIPALRWSAILFLIGTMLFSFSIYLAVTFDIPRAWPSSSERISSSIALQPRTKTEFRGRS